MCLKWILKLLEKNNVLNIVINLLKRKNHRRIKGQITEIKFLKKQKSSNKMVEISQSTLNTNGLKTPIKNKKTSMDFFQIPDICCIQEMTSKY